MCLCISNQSFVNIIILIIVFHFATNNIRGELNNTDKQLSNFARNGITSSRTVFPKSRMSGTDYSSLAYISSSGCTCFRGHNKEGFGKHTILPEYLVGPISSPTSIITSTPINSSLLWGGRRLSKLPEQSK